MWTEKLKKEILYSKTNDAIELLNRLMPPEIHT